MDDKDLYENIKYWAKQQEDLTKVPLSSAFERVEQELRDDEEGEADIQE
ncbi:hypothetical protein [Paenibacillus gansuensis]|uniref:Uncharacterized protein n=1 Tax=Paenibacillus gansuensis TaxID=306542 RepID=A0ABW5P976_9BACL